MSDARPIGFFDSGVGGLTVLREVRPPAAARSRRSTSATTPARRTARARTTRCVRFSGECLDQLAGARRQGHRGRLQHVHRRSRSHDSAPRYDVPILGVVRPGATAAALATRNRRVGVIATAGDGPLARLLPAIKDEDPSSSVLRARRRRRWCPWSKPAGSTGPLVEDVVVAGAARRRLRGRRSPTRSRAHRHAAAGLHPLPAAGPVIERDRRARHRGHRLGLGDRLRAGQPAGGRTACARRPATSREHRQLTTGDVEAFRAHRRAPVRAPVARGRGGAPRPARATATAGLRDGAGGAALRLSRATASAPCSVGVAQPTPGSRGRPAVGVARRARAGRPALASAPHHGDARRASSTGDRAERIAASPPARGARALCQRRARGGGTGLRGGHGAHRAAARAAARDAPAGRRGAPRGRRPGRLGARQHRRPSGTWSATSSGSLRPRHRPRATGRRAMAAVANRFLTTQPGRLPARLTWAPACWASTTSRCCRPSRRPGRLLFVEENIRATARALGVPLDDFRTLDRAPRDDPRLRDRGPPVAPALPRASGSSGSWRCSSTRRARSRRRASRHLMRALAGGCGGGLDRGLPVPEQRGLLRETQLVMSLMEGFSDWVMDEVGAAGAAGRRRHPPAVRGSAAASAGGGVDRHRRPPDRPRPQARAVPARRALRGGRRRGRRRRGHPPPVGRPRAAAHASARWTTPPRGCGASCPRPRSPPPRPDRPSAPAGPDARRRSRRRARGHRADAHPLGALPRRRTWQRIAQAAPGVAAGQRLPRGARGRPARRCRGAAPRAAAGGDLRPPPGPLPAAALGPLRDGRRRAGPDAGRARARSWPSPTRAASSRSPSPSTC